MIPKIIHYCWFGQNAKPKLTKKCLASWHKYCPDYRIVEWNEQNFDLDQHPYLRWCHDNGKWAFLSDLARLLIVQEHGGLYFDTDVELIQSPDALLSYDAFFGFETDEFIATGLGFGSVSNHPALQAMIDRYLVLTPNDSGVFPTVGCPIMNTEALLPFGLKRDGSRQSVSGVEVLPSDWLNPYDDTTGRMNKTGNTVSIHWYGKSWMSKSAIIRSTLTKPFHRVFGVDCFDSIKGFFNGTKQ